MNPLNPLTFFRATLPPWSNLSNPLIRHEIRAKRRASRRPWTLVCMGYGLAIGIIGLMSYGIYDLNNSGFSHNPLAPIIDSLLAFISAISALFVAIAHWRLILAISGRAAGMIAARRLRGDWELIFIAPLDKTRWYRAQLTALAWQVWPITRQLLGVQIFLAVIVFGLSTQEIIRDYSSDTFIETLHPLPHLIGLLPFLALFALGPLIETSLYASISLYLSSKSKRSTMAMMYSFGAIYATRIVIAFVLIFCIMAFTVTVNGLFNPDYSPGRIGIDGIFLSLSLYCLFGILILGFGIEWLPISIALLLADANIFSDNYFVGFMNYLAILVAFAVAYGLVPFGMMRLLTDKTIHQLQEPER